MYRYKKSLAEIRRQQKFVHTKSFGNKLVKSCASRVLIFNMYSLHNLLCTPINEYYCAKPTMFVTSDAINIQHNTSANKKSSLFIIINIQQSSLHIQGVDFFKFRFAYSLSDGYSNVWFKRNRLTQNSIIDG